MKNYINILSFAISLFLLAGCTMEGDISDCDDFVAPIGYFKNLDYNGDRVKIRVKNVDHDGHFTLISLEIQPKFGNTESLKFQTNFDEYLYLHGSGSKLKLSELYYNGNKKTSYAVIENINELFTIDLVFPMVSNNEKYVDLVMPTYGLTIEKMAVH